MLPMAYLSMVMMFQFNSQEGLIYIHNGVENCLEIRLMEDLLEKDHLAETHLEDCHMIHMLDFTNGWHLIHECSCHHGTHWLRFDMS
jgi:hypothetical protein